MEGTRLELARGESSELQSLPSWTLNPAQLLLQSSSRPGSLRHIFSPVSFRAPTGVPGPSLFNSPRHQCLLGLQFLQQLLTYGYHWVLAGLAKELFLEAFRSAVDTGAKALNDWGLRWFRGCTRSYRARSRHVLGKRSRRKWGRQATPPQQVIKEGGEKEFAERRTQAQ